MEPMQAAVEGVPELRAWWDETRELGSSLHSQSIDLAYELLDNRPGELITLLHKLSAGIDMLLDRHDDHDEISLGFLEVLVAESAERGLDRVAMRGALGPIALRQWDSLDRDRGTAGAHGPAA
jgi:hypothetical protein